MNSHDSCEEITLVALDSEVPAQEIGDDTFDFFRCRGASVLRRDTEVTR